MRVLLIHNKYQQAGGEDIVCQSEGELLQKYGHLVKWLVFDSKSIKTPLDKLLSGIFLVYNPFSAQKLRKHIKEFNPDVIHVHNFVPIASPSVFFTAKRMKKPVVMTLHNYRLLCPSTTLYFDHNIYEASLDKYFPIDAIRKGVYRNSSMQTAALVMMTFIHKLLATWRKKVDKYIVLTSFAFSKFEKSTLGIRRDQFVIKSNFVEDGNFVNQKRKDFFLFVGRLTEEKGIRTLLSAARILQFSLIIVGGGPLEDQVRHCAEQNPKVQYLGFRDRTFILELMGQCKALIFPSVWYEGFPMTILESFSTGTPVITSRLGSMAEVVQDRINGLHFESGNEYDLTEKLNMLLNDAELCEELGMQARMTYLRKYTPSKNYEQLIGIYQEVIGQEVVNQ